MSLADRIRDHARVRYLEPARQSGAMQVKIRAGDVHASMGLKSRMPAVCGALGSSALQEDCGIALVGRAGPHQGSNAVFMETRASRLHGEAHLLFHGQPAGKLICPPTA